MPAGLSRSAAAFLPSLDGHFTPNDLKKAYRRASLRCHPDKAGVGSTKAFQRVRDAYEFLQHDLESDFTSRIYEQAAADDMAWFFSRDVKQDRSKWGFPVSYERSTRWVGV
jgi:hypothetical protein